MKAPNSKKGWEIELACSTCGWFWSERVPWDIDPFLSQDCLVGECGGEAYITYAKELNEDLTA